MKASHLVTPRSYGDAVFIPSADPIERYVRPPAAKPALVFLAVVLTLAAVTLMTVR